MGLGPALDWLAEEMQRSYRLVVSLNGVEHCERLAIDKTVLSVLFRCVRELLMNVAKHAKVHAAEVSITRGDKDITVRVTDAGVGFDSTLLAQPGAGGRFGLVSVRERVGFVDGTFTIESIPGDGTAATIKVPLLTQKRRPVKKSVRNSK
jgi:signal transduction histidine kinase